MADGLEVEGICLAVRDLARVTAFYRDVVGLAVLATTDTSAGLGVDGRTMLQLLHRPAALPDERSQAGLFHMAVLLPARADLARWIGHAVQHGVALQGSADHLVSEAFYLADPEGNGVEVYADRSRSQWRWTGDAGARRIQMANRAIDTADLLRGVAGRWAGAPAGTRLGHVHLRVGDPDTAQHFYGGVLGLDVTAAWPGAAFLSSGGYHHHVAANAWHSAGAGPRNPARAGLVSVTLRAGQEAYAGIAARSGLGNLACGLQDPWGTAIRFTQPTEEPTQ